MFIYLAGPIAGCDEKTAVDWRDEAEVKLKPLVGVSPLRCEPPNKDGIFDSTLKSGRKERKIYSRTDRAIGEKNLLDVTKCDAILAYMPAKLISKRPSWGTAFEIGMAMMARKPFFIVSEHEELVDHPLVKHFGGGIFKTLDQAIEVIKGLYVVYSKEEDDAVHQ